MSETLPMIDAFPRFFYRAFTVKKRMNELCNGEGVVFFNARDDFTKGPYFYRENGIHLNDMSSARCSRL